MAACLILPCAGSGKRFGGEEKQLRLINGIPVFIRSLKPFIKLLEHIVIPCQADLREKVESALREHSIDGVQVIDGGNTRLESVYLGLLACPAHCDKVLVHDAVRPCVETSLIQQCLDCLDHEVAVVSAIPCPDTIKRASDSLVEETLCRDDMFLAQTPQGFLRSKLLEHYAAAVSSAASFTDDAALCESHGIKVKIVTGSRNNIKITFAEDLDLASSILAARNNCS